MTYVALAALESQSGFISFGTNDPLDWGTRADKIALKEWAAGFDAIVVGSRTLQTLPPSLLRNTSVIFVMTRHSKVFLPPRLQFAVTKRIVTFPTLQDIVSINGHWYSGCQNVLVLGGKRVYDSFVGLDIIDEARITIAPRQDTGSLVGPLSDIMNEPNMRLTGYKFLQDPDGTTNFQMTFRKKLDANVIPNLLEGNAYVKGKTQG